MTNHKKIENILQEFCDSRQLVYKRSEKQLQVVVTYTYEIAEQLEDLSINYHYSFDVPDRGARTPKFTIRILSNRDYPSFEVKRNHFLFKLFNSNPYRSTSQINFKKSTEDIITKLISEVPNGHINAQPNKLDLQFNWFPDDANHLSTLRQLLLKLEAEITAN